MTLEGYHIKDSDVYFLHKFLYATPKNTKGFLLSELSFPDADLSERLKKISKFYNYCGEKMKFDFELTDRNEIGNSEFDFMLEVQLSDEVSSYFVTQNNEEIQDYEQKYKEVSNYVYGPINRLRHAMFSELDFEIIYRIDKEIAKYIYLPQPSNKSLIYLRKLFKEYLLNFTEGNLAIGESNILTFQSQVNYLRDKINANNLYEKYGCTFIFDDREMLTFISKDFLFFHTLFALDVLNRIDLIESDIVFSNPLKSSYRTAKLCIVDDSLLLKQATKNSTIQRGDSTTIGVFTSVEGEIKIQNKKLSLTHQCLIILDYFLKHDNQHVNISTLIEIASTHKTLSKKNIQDLISKIRKEIKKHTSSKYIKTNPINGYSFHSIGFR